MYNANDFSYGDRMDRIQEEKNSLPSGKVFPVVPKEVQTPPVFVNYYHLAHPNDPENMVGNRGISPDKNCFDYYKQLLGL